MRLEYFSEMDMQTINFLENIGDGDINKFMSLDFM